MPLLVEVGLTEALRPLVVVFAELATQVTRAMQRDHLPEADVRARIAAQLPLAEKVRLADHVIRNDGSLESARAQADATLDSICEKLSIPRERYPRPSTG